MEPGSLEVQPVLQKQELLRALLTFFMFWKPLVLGELDGGWLSLVLCSVHCFAEIFGDGPASHRCRISRGKSIYFRLVWTLPSWHFLNLSCGVEPGTTMSFLLSSVPLFLSPPFSNLNALPRYLKTMTLGMGRWHFKLSKCEDAFRFTKLT